MKRREFISLVGGAAALWAFDASAQQAAKVWRIGLLTTAAPVADNSPFGVPLVRGLAQHGYIQGRNVVFDRRGADGRLERLPRLVEELVASNVDVILTFGYPSALAAKQGTAIPVVAFGTGDPVATGLVDSLARPGGNLTGFSDEAAELSAKRLELLKEIAPQLRRVAMLWNADDLGMTLRYQASDVAAKAMGISVQALGVREPDDFEQAFAAMNRETPDAILMVSDSLTTLNRKRVIDFATAQRLPAIYEWDFIAREGGLMSYSMDLDESFERVAALIDRILRGAKPAELPCEQPTRFHFVLNLKTAKALGLTIPRSLLVQANEVIE
jgi:putative tryptophan/tyrosine transport system substrate-binding protein